ncbi:MAG: alpha/beta hydrolase [Spirochaetales bacterium]|nr:alpha/beta hydrolase [Spirochaetales bacterium]
MNINIHNEKRIRLSNAFINSLNFLKVDSDIVSEKKVIETFDGSPIDLYIYKPLGINENLPCMVYFHGGGFYLKGDALSPKILSEYIRRGKFAVIYVDYRLSLDYPYPIPLEDCYSGLTWCYNNASYLGIDPSKIFVTGFSAGGALAAGVSLLARDRDFKIIKCQTLIAPVTDHRQITESVKNYNDTPNWNSESNSFMWELYLRNVVGDIPFYASPATSPSFSNLPPTYIEVSEFDPLHDEGVNLHNSLKLAGNITELNNTKGTIHMSSIQLRSKKTIKNMERMLTFINRRLYGK